MKRDPQYPVTISGNPPTLDTAVDLRPVVRALFLNPRGRRVAVSSDGTCHGLKRMPVERVRKSDGAVVGQVYLRGAQWKGVVREGTLWDGTPVSWIFAELPARDTIVLPCPLDRDLWNASGRSVGAPLPVFAFQAGIEDLSVARAVQDALTRRQPLPPGVVAGSEVIPWVGSPDYVAPFPKEDKAAYAEVLLDGSLEWDDWRDSLGWKGPGASLAAMELRDAVLRGGKTTMVAFPG